MDFRNPEEKDIIEIAKEWGVEIKEGGIEEIHALYKNRMENIGKSQLIAAIRLYSAMKGAPYAQRRPA